MPENGYIPSTPFLQLAQNLLDIDERHHKRAREAQEDQQKSLLLQMHMDQQGAMPILGANGQVTGFRPRTAEESQQRAEQAAGLTRGVEQVPVPPLPEGTTVPGLGINRQMAPPLPAGMESLQHMVGAPGGAIPMPTMPSAPPTLPINILKGYGVKWEPGPTPGTFQQVGYEGRKTPLEIEKARAEIEKMKAETADISGIAGGLGKSARARLQQAMTIVATNPKALTDEYVDSLNLPSEAEDVLKRARESAISKAELPLQKEVEDLEARHAGIVEKLKEMGYGAPEGSPEKGRWDLEQLMPGSQGAKLLGELKEIETKMSSRTIRQASQKGARLNRLGIR